MRSAFLVFLIAFCQSLGASEHSNKLSFLFYNVENLFDTTHDEKKNDWTFLPKETLGKKEECLKIRSKYYKKQCLSLDWTQDKLDLKLNQIAKVIQSLNKNIDLIALAEVENKNVVSMLAKKLGKKNFIVSESPDKRGIDLALIYTESDKIKKIFSKEHQLTGQYFEKKPTRNILEVELLVKGKHRLTVFINHWPSPSNPSHTRVSAAKVIQKRMGELLRRGPKRNIIAVGDFNTIPRDEPHPLQDYLYQTKLFSDVHELASKANLTDKRVKGTYFYYRGQVWNHLDKILINRNLFDRKEMEFDVASFRIYAPTWMKVIKRFGKKFQEIPYSYNFNAKKKTEAGYSDHFPLYSEFLL